jgi:heat shock protein HslJ
MQFEQSFWKTLQGASEFELKGGNLTITDEESGNFLRFERVVKPLLCLPRKD